MMAVFFKKLAKILVALVVTLLLALALPWPIFVSNDDVAKIEILLANNACVDDLDKWSRDYRFLGHESFTPDFEKIIFFYEDPSITEPDGVERQAGRHTPWKQSLLFGKAWTDDRQQRVVSGTFNRESEEITDLQCGCSIPSTSSATFPICK